MPFFNINVNTIGIFSLIFSASCLWLILVIQDGFSHQFLNNIAFVRLSDEANQAWQILEKSLDRSGEEIGPI
jgi:hypothetical protein